MVELIFRIIDTEGNDKKNYNLNNNNNNNKLTNLCSFVFSSFVLIQVIG